MPGFLLVTGCAQAFLPATQAPPPPPPAAADCCALCRSSGAACGAWVFDTVYSTQNSDPADPNGPVGPVCWVLPPATGGRRAPCFFGGGGRGGRQGTAARPLLPPARLLGLSPCLPPPPSEQAQAGSAWRT